MQNAKVKVGQVWKEMDPRSASRPELTVLRIDGEYAILGKPSGRATQVKISRMKPGSRGYQLVRDVEIDEVP